MTDSMMRRAANFSRCRQYRYALWRQWGDAPACALIIGLNPSTADHRQDDPTIRRCIGFARDWGYQRLCVANLFAFRATYPDDLKAAADPVGPANDRWLRKLMAEADCVVAAWGNDGAWLDRSAAVRRLCDHWQVLRINRSGQPAHPLYLPARLRPRRW